MERRAPCSGGRHFYLSNKRKSGASVSEDEIRPPSSHFQKEESRHGVCGPCMWRGTLSLSLHGQYSSSRFY